MKSLKEMTGIELVEAFIGKTPSMVEEIFLFLEDDDLRILSPEARSRIMEFVSKQDLLFNPVSRSHFVDEYVAKFLTFIGINSFSPINEAEIIEKSIVIGGRETARNLFYNVIKVNPSSLKGLTKEAKEKMLNHLYVEGRIAAEKKVLNEDNFRSPEHIAGLKALLA